SRLPPLRSTRSVVQSGRGADCIGTAGGWRPPRTSPSRLSHCAKRRSEAVTAGFEHEEQPSQRRSAAAAPGSAKDSPALFLNQRGQRLSVRGAHDIITGIAAAAGLDDDTTVHILRHTFATALVRGGTDLVIVAELLGHARLETTRGYIRPSAEDRTRALDLLPVDK